MRKTGSKGKARRVPSAAAATSIPAPGQGKRGEGGHLGYLLRQAGVAFRLRMDRALADLELTPPQFAVLTMLASYPGLSGADLARLSLLTPQTVSVIVGNLERAELIRRRPHSVHGRIQQIDVTEEGRSLLEKSRKRVNALERSLAEGLSKQDELAVRKWLAAVAVSESE